jgi:hypothetical protein
MVFGMDKITFEDLSEEDKEVLLRLQSSPDPDLRSIGLMLRGIIMRIEDFYREFTEKQNATKDIILDHQKWLEHIDSFLGGASRRVVKQSLPPLTRDPNIIERVLELRSQGMSIREIAATMSKEGLTISKSKVAEILKEHTESKESEDSS